MLQAIIDGGLVPWGDEGTKPTKPRMGKDKPFLCCVLGVSTSRQVACLFNEAVWDLEGKFSCTMSAAPRSLTPCIAPNTRVEPGCYKRRGVFQNPS